MVLYQVSFPWMYSTMFQPVDIWVKTNHFRVYTYSIVLLKEASKGLWKYVSQHLPCISKIHPGKLLWKWKTNHLKMYIILKLVMFHCHVSFRDVFGTVGIWSDMFVLQDLQAKGRVLRKALENSTKPQELCGMSPKIGKLSRIHVELVHVSRKPMEFHGSRLWDTPRMYACS